MAKLRMYLDGKLTAEAQYNMKVKPYERYQQELIQLIRTAYFEEIKNAKRPPIFCIEGVRSAMSKRHYSHGYKKAGRPATDKVTKARILYLRKEEGRTLRQIAADTGVSETTVNNILKAKPKQTHGKQV